MTDPGGIQALQALREQFDRSFAAVPQPPASPEDLLEIVVGTQACVLRISELRAIVGRVRVTPLPTRVRELLGVAEFRGDVLPVYDLGALLGQPGRTPVACVAIAAARPVAIGFDATGRHHRAGGGDILPHVGSGPGMPHVREMLHAADGVRPIVSLASLVADIERRASAVRAPEGDTRR